MRPDQFYRMQNLQTEKKEKGNMFPNNKQVELDGLTKIYQEARTPKVSKKRSCQKSNMMV